ncbi:hypothetical protein POL68_21930 [Stigmatella sp. ncwal1]|uniref:YhhN-like protein n=1 Tax=Stigmatella ashevillensis TaxID=2995309 RepID=A0ABT5DDM1_9BACT|nr:lysoplasmalogenase family protein [Stigmatella ashevillena]MDC0711144.1 hypothetical protein [Stigmatella ashevillena]
MSHASTAYKTHRERVISFMIIVALMVFLTGGYQGMGWMVYYLTHLGEGCKDPICTSLSEYAASTAQHAGFARTILALLMVLLIGQSWISRSDYRFLAVAFGLTVVADYFLVYRNDNFLAGLGVFTVVHMLYTLRHARGFAESLLPPKRTRTLTLLSLSAAGVLLMSTAVLWWIHMKTREMSLPPPGVAVIIYLTVLSLSLWMAWGTLIRQGFTRFSAWLIAAGMTSFYLCDVCVGMSFLLQGADTKPGSFFDNCVGFFYSPALALLAISGYRWLPAPFFRLEPGIDGGQDSTLSLNPGT